MIRIGYTLSMMRETGKKYPNWENIARVKEAGFDYVELPLNDLIALTRIEFDHILELLIKNDIRCETLNQALPQGMRIVGHNINECAICDYLDRAEKVIHTLSAKRIIFGCAASKNLAEGEHRTMAIEQTVHFLQMFSDRLHPTHEIIAIEPINRLEANFITNLKEAQELKLYTGRENIGICADYFHMVTEHEPWEMLKNVANSVVQLHFCQTDRGLPFYMDESMKEFIKMVKEIRYEKRMTLEANCFDPNALQLSVEELRKYL